MKENLKQQQFASDNYSGICPEAIEYLLKVNTGHEPAYGEDRWTREACDAFRSLFQKECEVFFISTIFFRSKTFILYPLKLISIVSFTSSM
jgi:hypothetical protein